jgi:hypothetical protein
MTRRAKKLELVVKDDFVDEGIVKHYLVVHRTCDKHNLSLWESLPQCPEKRHSTEHVAELVVLSNDEDIPNSVEWDFTNTLVREEKTEKSA